MMAARSSVPLLKSGAGGWCARGVRSDPRSGGKARAPAGVCSAAQAGVSCGPAHCVAQRECWREASAADGPVGAHISALDLSVMELDLLSDLMWLPIIWFTILAWDWASQQACQFLARFASPHRRREWGYQ